MNCPEIGEKIRFRPRAFAEGLGIADRDIDDRRGMVTGRVTYINRAHRFYCVAFEAGETTMHECFKF